MKIFPWKDVLKNADDRIKEGWDVHQQWNCEHCGAKQTMPDINKFYMMGICEECGKTTNIKANGHNFMAVGGVDNDSQRTLFSRPPEDKTTKAKAGDS